MPQNALPDQNATILSILQDSRTIAVVGLSPKPERDSHHVAEYLQQQGYRIVPVNPVVAQGGGSILGEICFASLSDAGQAIARQGGRIDMVDCFRKSEDIPPLAEDAIAIGASCLWLQLGVVNEDAARRAEDAGLQVIQNRCVKIEHARLFGGLGWMGVNTGVITAKRLRQLPY